MKKVGPLIENMLRSYNLWQGYQQYLLVQSWDEVVGPAMAEVTRAESMSKGILRVAVKDSVWAYHLSMMKPQLISKMNAHARGKLVKDLFFNIGSIEKNEKEEF